jgi:hypothetical protein
MSGIAIVVLALYYALRYLIRVPSHNDGTDPQQFLKDGSRYGLGNDSERLL